MKKVAARHPSHFKSVSLCKLTIGLWITGMQGNAVSDYITPAASPYLDANLFKTLVAREQGDTICDLSP